MNTQYTPGPWRWIGSRQSPDERIYLSTPDGYANWTDLKSSESAANAQLIAAAPMLAEALKACADALDIAFEYDGDVFRKHHNDVTDALMSARAALAAAGVLS